MYLTQVRGVVRNLSKGGVVYNIFFSPGGAQHTLGIKNSLKLIDFTNWGGIRSRSPPLIKPLCRGLFILSGSIFPLSLFSKYFKINKTVRQTFSSLFNLTNNIVRQVCTIAHTDTCPSYIVKNFIFHENTEMWQ